MEIFKGYVPTKDKKCIFPFKGKTSKELMSLKQVEKREEYAGILADETILIDVDDAEQSEIVMKIVEQKELVCRVYQTTRGKHFIFNNYDCGEPIVSTNKIKCCLACGITADIKVGHRNSYSILKYDGKKRKILYDKLDDEDYQTVPKFLQPVKYSFGFLAMSAGDGRNQALFNYILTLQSSDFSVDECRECIRVINDFVLKDPLEETELQTILRDESFKKTMFFNKHGSFLFDKFATYLKINHHIIKIGGQLHTYKNGVYVAGSKRIESAMIKTIPNLNRTKRLEVMTYLDVLIDDNTPMSDAKYICFKNGVLNIETVELMEHSPEYIITNQIGFNYIPDAYNGLTDRTLDKISCDDPQIRMLIEEVAGYVLYRRNELRKSFILIGDKANGKSTYLDMIKTMLGNENISALDLKELGDRFKTAELFGKLANIGDDIGDDFISNPAVFKKLVSGDTLNAERKGSDPFDFSNYSKLLFSANNIPRIKDKSGAVVDRMVIIPFNAHFSKLDPDYDPHIKYKLRQTSSMEYLITLAVEGLKRVLNNNGFTVSDKVQKELEEYTLNNNPILLFFKEDPKIENEPTSKVYRKYSEFCTVNSFTPMSNIEFSKQVKKHYGMDIAVKSINGKKYRVFLKL